MTGNAMSRLHHFARTACLSALACCLALVTFAALAQQAYPSRPIELVVPWGPGGGSDQTGREIGKLLEKELKVSLPVVNAPGATGNAGIQKMLAGQADGYSIAVLSADTLYANLTGGTQKWTLDDLAVIAVMIQQPSGFYVTEGSRYKTWADVLADAKSKQAGVKVAISGFGSPDDITIGYFNARGFKMNAVPFANPGERYASLMGGHSDLLYSPLGNIRGMVEGKQMRPVIVFGNKRVAAYPEIPCSKELGYEVSLPQFRAIVMKAGTDPQKVKVMADALTRVYADPDYAAFLKSLIATDDSYVPAKDARAFMQGEFESVRKVMAASQKK
jgi:tripartite-type tricarboxylate transporter receptor subunit TctC